MAITTADFDLPAYWACAMINGDLTGYDDDDLAAIDAFAADMIAQYGHCHCLAVTDDESNFRRYHDATPYGVLACNIATFTFDITAR